MLSLFKEKEQYAGNEYHLYDELIGPCRQLGIGVSAYEKGITDINYCFSFFCLTAKLLDTFNLDINTTEFMLSTAHQKEDLIDRYLIQVFWFQNSRS